MSRVSRARARHACNLERRIRGRQSVAGECALSEGGRGKAEAMTCRFAPAQPAALSSHFALLIGCTELVLSSERRPVGASGPPAYEFVKIAVTLGCLLPACSL